MRYLLGFLQRIGDDLGNDHTEFAKKIEVTSSHYFIYRKSRSFVYVLQIRNRSITLTAC